MEQPVRARVHTLVLDGYVTLIAAILVWPLVSRTGYPVARDLVFTPRIPLRPEIVGMGTGSARAAPLDAVLAVITSVIDGAIVAKIVVPLALLLAGWGAHRIVAGAGLVARAVVAGLAVWNPFVIERLGLGQWALLFGYAAVIHLVRVALTRTDDGSMSRAAPWLAVGAVTPTGAVLAGGAGVVMLIRRSRTSVALLVLVLAVQLPWVLPGLLSAASATSDPGGVAAFAARGERPGGAVWSLLGMGGIWDGLSVPGSRTGWLGHLTSIVVLVVLALGWRTNRVPVRLWLLGAGSFVLATISSTRAGQVLLEWAVGVVPGAGLLRDAQKWLVGFVVLVLVCTGWSVHAIMRAVHRRMPAAALGGAAAAVVTPFLLMPDGAVVVHQVVRPVDYPKDYSEVAARVDNSDSLVVGLPWRLYRAYDWAGPYAAYDPSSRWFDTPVAVPDTLVLGDRTIDGEDQLAALLADAATHEDLAALHDRGVRFVLLHPDAMTDPEDIPRGHIVQSGPSMSLIDLGSPQGPPPEVTTAWSGLARLVGVVDLGVLVLIVVVSLSKRLDRRSNSATLR